MARNNSNVGDKTYGICFHPSHDVPIWITGKIITGSGDTINSDAQQSNVGDKVLSDCGHEGTIITGAPSVFNNDMKMAGIGDKTTGWYRAKITTGSDTTFIE